MKQFVINIVYRLRGYPEAPLQEMQLVAHSIQDAKSAFSLWQLRTQNFSNSKPPLYVIVSATKLKEVQDTEVRKEWLRLHPDRVKSQIYVCPYCQETCYGHSYGCDYIFCPWCARKIR